MSSATTVSFLSMSPFCCEIMTERGLSLLACEPNHLGQETHKKHHRHRRQDEGQSQVLFSLFRCHIEQLSGEPTRVWRRH